MRVRLVIVAVVLAVIALVVAVGLRRTPPQPTSPTSPASLASPASGAAAVAAAVPMMFRNTDRVQKETLVELLPAAPQVIVLGGSRALRFDPAYIRQMTGLSAFNAAVSHARPEDAWAFVNLFHDRFPAARFHFLWVIHADEFDPQVLDPGLVTDPILSRYFPAAVVAAQRTRDQHAFVSSERLQNTRIFAPDGMVMHDLFAVLNPRPGADAAAVKANIQMELQLCRPSDRLSARSCYYFEQTLALMERIGAAPPVVVAAPFDARICAATINRGWGARHRLVLAFLARLTFRYRFDFADFSRASSCGCTADDFYDGIHLRPSGAQKVFDAVLRLFPAAFRPAEG